MIHEEIVYRDPKEIIAELMTLEAEIKQGLADLNAMLG